MKETVLITGGSGLLGLNWALATRDRFAVILGLHAREIALAGVETQHISLESVECPFRALEKIEPLIVIHTAGLTSVEACEADPQLAQRINVDVAENVARACARLGLLLAHISTDHLFSGQTSHVTETDPVSPQNVYARTKAEAESRVLDANPQALVVRTNFFGWGPFYRRSFSDVILAALRNGSNLTLFEDVFYTPILCETLVHAVHELIDVRSSGIFHIVGDDRISKYEFGLKVAERFQLDASLIKAGRLADQPTLVHRPRDMSLSNQKASRLLGRKLGGVNEHLERLLWQEECGLAAEMQNL